MPQLRTPQSIIDVSIFVDGLGFIGTVDKDGVKLPEIAILRESITAGGFEQEYSTGVFKKLEYELVIKEINTVIFDAMSTGIASGNGINFTIKGSTIQDGTKRPVVVTLQSIPDIAIDGATTTLKGVATLYIYEYDGTELCMLDTKNMIGKIGGVDYLETLRTHIQ